MKVAVVGASGYGNIGDDIYPLVLRAEFPECEFLIYNSDLPESLPADIGLLVLCGGGILHNGNAEPEHSTGRHCRLMQFYMDWAMEKGIPWGILSCGLQFTSHREAFYRQALTPWVPYFHKASFFTVRSPACQSIIRELTGREDVKYFPDLAYLYEPEPAGAIEKQDVITLVPAGFVNPRNALTNHMLVLLRSIGYRVAWLSMGAAVDDDPLMAYARTLFPDAEIIEGCTPATAFRQIGQSRFVFSGRYHGMVLARRFRIPFYVPQDSPYKIKKEDYGSNPADAWGHIETLRDVIERVDDVAPIGGASGSLA